MKVDENSDTAFLLLSTVFLIIIASAMALINAGFIYKYGFRRKRGTLRKGLLISLAINASLVGLAFYSTQYL